ncbi:DUF1295 domain-containing protein [Parvularcula sp. IMCC14364]|uniref:DUF1295 domain-containing protein n=1 Tax=Parvularcula sp. IMCC14364 TaxID=3067902 RepID=UPI002740370E|nr:DUF1295 domain-containing protein [Parvularcula sp. IMCC14364]
MLTMIMTNFVIMLMIFIFVWAISVVIKNASIVDILWGPACAGPAVLTYFLADGTEPRALVLTILTALWGGRLGLYLARRNLGHGEDFRYVAMRESVARKDGNFVIWSLYRVFLLQLCIAFFVSLPTQVGQIGGPETLGLLAITGIVIFSIGLFFEAVGDWQLRQFKAEPENKGKLMTTGLWAWTRHPNYFGDAAVWTGLTMIALEAPWGWTTVLSPALMIFFLYAVSGKALLEKSMVKKYPEYADYKRRTSGFFPLPPKKV